MNINTDPTTKLLLGVIATGVAALTALAFERRYQNCCANSDFPQDDGPTDFGTNSQPRHGSLNERIGGRVDNLRDKAEAWKDKVSDSIEHVADKVKDGIKHGVDTLKDGAGEAATETKKTAEEAASELKKTWGST